MKYSLEKNLSVLNTVYLCIFEQINSNLASTHLIEVFFPSCPQQESLWERGGCFTTETLIWDKQIQCKTSKLFCLFCYWKKK